LKKIEELLRDKNLTGGAERTLCCYKGDAIAEMESDFKYFSNKETYDVQGVNKRIELVKACANMSQAESWAFSSAYPTMI
jgi:hypothetical protein